MRMLRLHIGVYFVCVLPDSTTHTRARIHARTHAQTHMLTPNRITLSVWGAISPPRTTRAKDQQCRGMHVRAVQDTIEDNRQLCFLTVSYARWLRMIISKAFRVLER